jgi:transposase
VVSEFWMSDRQWAVLEPLIPMNRRGVRPWRNCEVIRGIVRVLKVRCCWRDFPEVYGPHTMIYNRFNRWSKAGIWQTTLGALVDPGSAGSQSIDSTTSKVHRCAAGGQRIVIFSGPDMGRGGQSGCVLPSAKWKILTWRLSVPTTRRAEFV